MSSKELSVKRITRFAPADSEYTVWDNIVVGLGIRVRTSGKKTWVLLQRFDNKQRKITLGQFPVMEVEQARKRARECLQAPLSVWCTLSFAQFASEYWKRSEKYWKPLTVKGHESYFRKRMLPAFGKIHLTDIDTPTISRWFDELSSTYPGSANRALSLLSTMMNRAEQWGYRPKESNPCTGIVKNKPRKIERYLSAEELARLNHVLEQEKRSHPFYVGAIRLLLLTGCRRGEIENLCWAQVGRDHITLLDSKTGPRKVLLSPEARNILASLKRKRGRCRKYVLSRKANAQSIYELRDFWIRIRAECGIGDVRLHDLRHNFASWAVMSGENLVSISKMLGHRRIETTIRYAHLDDRHLLRAADRISQHIAKLLRDLERSPSPKG